MLTTDQLSNAKIVDRSDGSDPTNESLQAIGELVAAYNVISGSENRIRHWKRAGAELLDALVVKAAEWMTTKPPKETQTNLSRWSAMEDLLEQARREMQLLDVRLLSGPSDFKQIDDQRRSYWLERLDPLHRAGFLLAPHYAVWRGSTTTDGFFTWLDKRFLVEKSVWVPGGYGAGTTQTVIEDKRPENLKSGVAYLDERQRERYRLHFRGDLIFDAKNKPFDTRQHSTAFSGKGWAIFVCSRATRKVYAASHVEAKFHHSSFLSGEPVLAAGELVVQDGKLRVISCKSGHYAPSAEDMQAFLRAYPNTRPGAIIKPEMKCEAYQCSEFRKQGLDAPKVSKAFALSRVPSWAKRPGSMYGFVPNTEWLFLLPD